MNELQKIIEEMRAHKYRAGPPPDIKIKDWANRLEAIAESATALKPRPCGLPYSFMCNCDLCLSARTEAAKKYALSVSDDPCPGCAPNTICRTPNCGRNKTEEMRRRFGGVK